MVFIFMAYIVMACGSETVTEQRMRRDDMTSKHRASLLSGRGSFFGTQGSVDQSSPLARLGMQARTNVGTADGVSRARG